MNNIQGFGRERKKWRRKTLEFSLNGMQIREVFLSSYYDVYLVDPGITHPVSKFPGALIHRGYYKYKSGDALPLSPAAGLSEVGLNRGLMEACLSERLKS